MTRNSFHACNSLAYINVDEQRSEKKDVWNTQNTSVKALRLCNNFFVLLLTTKHTYINVMSMRSEEVCYYFLL